MLEAKHHEHLLRLGGIVKLGCGLLIVGIVVLSWSISAKIREGPKEAFEGMVDAGMGKAQGIGDGALWDPAGQVGHEGTQPRVMLADRRLQFREPDALLE